MLFLFIKTEIIFHARRFKIRFGKHNLALSFQLTTERRLPPRPLKQVSHKPSVAEVFANRCRCPMCVYTPEP